MNKKREDPIAVMVIRDLERINAALLEVAEAYVILYEGQGLTEAEQVLLSGARAAIRAAKGDKS